MFVSLRRQDPEHFRFARAEMIPLYETGHFAKDPAHYRSRIRSREPGTLSEPIAPNPLPGGDPGLPFRDDVTDRSSSTWTRLQPEPIRWSPKGSMRRWVTMSLSKPSTEGRIPSRNSQIVTYNPVEILIHSADRESIQDYRLVRFDIDGGERKAALGPVTGGTVIVPKSVAFGADWMGDNLFKLYFPDTLRPGEYCLFKASSVAQAVNAFDKSRRPEVRTFRVIE